MRRISTLSLGLIVLAAVLVAPAARADNKKNILQGQPAIRHRLELRRLRFEIAPQFVISMNQDFKHFIGGGLVLDFHITDWLGIGLQAAFGGGLDTGLADSVNRKLISETSGMFANRPFAQPSSEQFQAHLASINLLGSLYAQVTPMAGKLAIFGSGYAGYDLYVLAGVGFMNLTNTWDSYVPGAGLQKLPTDMCTNSMASPDPNLCDPKNAGVRVSGVWGIGIHLFFNEWLALNLEVRGFVTTTNMGGLDINGDRALDGKDSTVTNSMFAALGLTILLPVHARISP